METLARPTYCRGMRTVALMILLMIATTEPAGAGPNAAREYQEALDRWQALPDANRAALENMAAPLHPCADSQTLEVMRGIFNDMMKASRRETCDFELDYSEGAMMLLPHLSDLRRVARVMVLDAQWNAQNGRVELAAEEFASIYRAGYHLGQDDVLISSLVGMSIWRMADEHVEQAIESGMIGPREAERILLALRKADAEDPFSFNSAVRKEKELFGEWAKEQIQQGFQEDGTVKMTEAMKEMLGITNADAVEHAGLLVREQLLEGMQEDGTVHMPEELREMFGIIDDRPIKRGELGSRMMEGYDRCMDEMIEAFEVDDLEAAKKQMSVLQDRLESDKYGVLAKLFVPSLGNLIEMKFESREELGDRTEQLEGIADQSIDPLENANAAWWYIRTARAINALPPEQQVDPEAAREQIDALLVATLIDRCEFPEMLYSPRPVIESWSTGIKRGIDLLLLDASQQMDSGNIDGCISMLVVVLQVASDLSANHSIVDSIIAQDATERTIAMVEALETAGSLDPQRRRKILEALRTIPSRDPFGYMAAADASRRLLGEYHDGMMMTQAETLPTDPDLMLFALAWHELDIDPEFGMADCWPLEIEYTVIEGLVSEAMIRDARALGNESREAASVGVELPMEPVPGIAVTSVKQRRAEGSTLLRTWKRHLDQQ